MSRAVPLVVSGLQISASVDSKTLQLEKSVATLQQLTQQQHFSNPTTLSKQPVAQYILEA